MKRNMNRWLSDSMRADRKKSMPLLSFPGTSLIGMDVNQLVHRGDLQAKCMKAIADRYDMAGAVSPMDLSVEAEAFGNSVRFSEQEPPAVKDCIVGTLEDALELAVPPVGAARTAECIRGIELAVHDITDRPVFAGVIRLFSLIGRLMDMQKVLVDCRKEPGLLHVLLKKASTFLTAYIMALKEAGANGVFLAEPAAELIAPRFHLEFSVPYIERIRARCEDDHFLCIYHNCGNTMPLLKDLVENTSFKALHLGNAIDMEAALRLVPGELLVMGNIDPANVLRLGTPEHVWEVTLMLLKRCGRFRNFILSSGCDIPPTAPLENIDAFFDAAAHFYGRESFIGRLALCRA